MCCIHGILRIVRYALWFLLDTIEQAREASTPRWLQANRYLFCGVIQQPFVATAHGTGRCSSGWLRLSTTRCLMSRSATLPCSTFHMRQMFSCSCDLFPAVWASRATSVWTDRIILQTTLVAGGKGYDGINYYAKVGRLLSSVNFEGKTFLPVWKIIKMPQFYALFAWKNTKLPSCTIYSLYLPDTLRKCRNFTWYLPEKLFCKFFFGGSGTSPFSLLPMPII